MTETRESVEEHLRQILQVASDPAVVRHARAALLELQVGAVFPRDLPITRAACDHPTEE